MNLEDFFRQHRRVALAFSGGVDSAYLLYAAKKYAEEVRAYYVKSAFQPAFEFNDAKRLAEELGIKLCIISIDVLANEKVRSNPPDRCYYCKQTIFSQIVKQAAADGFTEILDGTNASDDAGDRPGMKALKELKVLSPLRMCGLTKQRIRELSKEAGLFTWNKASYACLATRLPVGSMITNERLEVTEKSEDFLMRLGFKNFRVRMIENRASKSGTSDTSKAAPLAKIEITEEQLPLFIEKRKEILSALKKDYSKILLDLETRNEE